MTFWYIACFAHSFSLFFFGFVFRSIKKWVNLKPCTAMENPIKSVTYLIEIVFQ